MCLFCFLPPSLLFDSLCVCLSFLCDVCCVFVCLSDCLCLQSQEENKGSILEEPNTRNETADQKYDRLLDKFVRSKQEFLIAQVTVLFLSLLLSFFCMLLLLRLYLPSFLPLVVFFPSPLPSLFWSLSFLLPFPFLTIFRFVLFHFIPMQCNATQHNTAIRRCLSVEVG